MDNETIAVTSENGKILEVVVVSKQPDAIWVVLGKGQHNVKCKLTPTHNGLAYAGSVMGREIVYARSVRQVLADLARHDQATARFRPH